MLKVPDERDQMLVAKVYKAQQQHVFAFWEELDEEQRRELLDQLAGFDFQQISSLAELVDAPAEPPVAIAPLPTERPDAARRAELEALGWEALKAGKVACLVVAGGQGTRLGWVGPKGTYPIGPVSGKSLFQLFAEQLRATGERAGRPLPWYVLTSRLNREATERAFAEAAYYGLDPAQVTFLTQSDLPNTDPEGKLLMATKSEVAASPNGHGGTFSALVDSDALDTLTAAGVEHLFYFQVDNPLCRVADPVFLGAHIAGGAEASTKVVRKEDPDEKIGLVVLRDGKAGVVEYSEMSAEEQQQRDPDGQLTFRGGNTAIHVFSLAFLQRLAEGSFKLHYHLARKKVPYVDAEGNHVDPDEPNGCKFETFIFEVLGEAQAHVALEVERADEFEPLKNSSGPYSPETVKAALSDLAKRWLEAAGAKVEAERYEVSPRTALDAAELASKLADLDLTVTDGSLSV
ncbi:MAG: UDPGP type 1 family protein [Planctomycetes bacterium]|nr:UDPGP type 1 family protein [Planctomycetota bacterium]